MVHFDYGDQFWAVVKGLPAFYVKFPVSGNSNELFHRLVHFFIDDPVVLLFSCCRMRPFTVASAKASS